MRHLVIAAAIVLAGAATANAQQAPASAAEASAHFDGDTPIETLLGTASTRPILLKYFPDIEKHPAFEQIKGMSLRQVAPFSNGLITDAIITSVETDLKAVK